MTRLQSEWQRLFTLPASQGPADALVDEGGRVRAMVLSLARPADWDLLSVVWKGVQADLGLPSPGIAVSGVDAFELWFSLMEAVPARLAHDFLMGLQARYLADVAPARVGLRPAPDGGAAGGFRHVDGMPGRQMMPDQWSAFVAHDLASMFTDTPWLDIPPGAEGQAELLAGLRCMPAEDWHAALERMKPVSAPDPLGAGGQAPAPSPDGDTGHQDPRRFLLGVMSDGTVDLALRIEAAKALLLSPPPR